MINDEWLINVVNSEIVFEMADSYSSQLTWYIAHRRVAFFVGKSYLLYFMRTGKIHFSASYSCALVCLSLVPAHSIILAQFGNFWANICLFHSTCCLTSCIFAWNHCGQIFCFRITQKIVPIWNVMKISA